jgi:hypothetical protein
MDENVWLPAKIPLGNILDLHDAGIDTVVEWDDCGDRRQKACWVMHSSILPQQGLEVAIHPLQPFNVTGWLDELLGGFPRRRSRRLVRAILRGVWASDLAMMRAPAAAASPRSRTAPPRR